MGDSDGAVGAHYLDLVLGRGAKQQCPQAEKYLCGVARDMTLNQQPYSCSLLAGRYGLQADDSVLSVLKKLDENSGKVPPDYSHDLALAVAVKALDLWSLGLDL